MRRLLTRGGIALLFLASSLFARSQEVSPSAATATSPHRILLNRYCVTCHNEKLKTAGLILEKIDLDIIAQNAPAWEKVIRKLRSGAMPPAGAPRPDKAAVDAFASYLEGEIDSAYAKHPNPGTTLVHRMNRAEYSNAVRDLLAIELDTSSLLPPDDAGYGFDNIGDVLAVSPVLLERYMTAARRVSRLAVGDTTIRPGFETYDVNRFLIQKDRMSDDLPFGSRGGIAIRHHFPLDGEYVFRIYLKTNYNGANVLGLARQHNLEFRLDGERVKVFPVGGEQKSVPQTKVDELARGDSDPGIELRIPVQAGTRLVGIDFQGETVAAEDVLKPEFASTDADSNFQPGIGKVTINGPFNAKGPGDTASRQRIFVCHPNTGVKDEEACAQKILASLARRAFRRPVTNTEVETLLEPYRLGRNDGSFDSGIQMAIQRILVSPEFLFRIERDPAGAAPGSVHPVSDVELASRLSFFIWSSLPDDELLDLASRGKLRDSETLDRQVRRMLRDKRSKGLVDNFAGQWLYLRNVKTALPDLAEYPEFDENLRESLEKETELFFGSLILEDRSVLEILNANFTYLNERLARHYGIQGVYGNHFRRVTLADENRWGLLGKGAILMVTSYSNRTAPTIRGKWLLENLLGAPPPPPPPNVPSLKDRGDDGKILSMRQQMEVHRANPACAVCHTRMDPLGFALENFDAIGKWRSTSGSTNTPIDSSGALPDGTKFQGPSELRKILLSKPDQFVGTVAEKLLTYSLGRGIEYYDQPAIRKIIRSSAPGNYKWSSLILSIAKSDPFQMRRTPEP